MAEVLLPNGFAVDGAWHRSAVLRPIGEADLWAARLPATARTVTSFLARCLVRLGPHSPVTEAQVGALPVGDREALLLHLQRLSFGDGMDIVLKCPHCDGRMDVSLSVSDLLLPPYEAVEPWRQVVCDGVELALRAPTGADQAAVAVVAEVDLDGAAEALLRRCIGRMPEGFELTPQRVEVLSGVLQEIDPQADLLLDFGCPDCGRPGQAALSAADYLMRQVTARQEALLREIHHLALHYHWSEAEILAVEPARRKAYLKLLGLDE